MATRLGVLFDGFDHAGETVRLAREAEAAGVASVWMAEHMGYREAIAASGAFAAVTERVMLVPTAVSPYLWHPTPAAMSLATLDEIAPGRVAVAVSVGNVLNLKESGHQPVKPVRALREFVEDLRALWSGEPVEREGLNYRLEGARMNFAVTSPIPVYIASTGPQVLHLAGRIADGVLLSGGLSIPYMRKCLAWADDGRLAAGRDAATMSRAGFIFFAVSADRRQAIEELRRKIAFLFRNDRQADNIASVGIPIDHEAIIAAVARRDLDAAAALVPEEAVAAFGVAGTPAECRAGLERYFDAGLDEPVVQIGGAPENRALALEVLREFAAG